MQHDIISKIREFIRSENLEAGDQLPSEGILAKRLGVSRANVSRALQKLELYGLVINRPAKGFSLTELGRVARDGMLDHLVNLDEPDFRALIEVRIELELSIVQFAAERRTNEDLQSIHDALDAFKAKILGGENSLQQDLLFHLAIAKASNNRVLAILMALITPEIIGSYDQDRVCKGDEAASEVKKHEDVYLAIKAGDPQLAKEKMEIHFQQLRAFLQSPP